MGEMLPVIKILNWGTALCGLWEAADVAAVFVPGFGAIPAFLWNHIAIGVILMFVGAWAALTDNLRTAATLDWIAAAAGVWLIIASFILRGPVLAAGLWNDVIVGLVVLVLASASGLLLRSRG